MDAKKRMDKINKSLISMEKGEGKANLEKENERITYHYENTTSDKDILIGQLKSHIFEIEQNERNFMKLNTRFKGLQNE